jgi:UDP-galactopyranose mutase
MFMKIIDNKNIVIHLNSTIDQVELDWITKPVIYTGRIDKIVGRNDLPFMTMGFETVLNGAFPWSNEYPVINFPQDFDFIRAHSSKLLYQQNTKTDVVVYEYPRRTGPECYPLVYSDSVRLWQDILVEVDKKYPNIIPAGRAGNFEYMNMDQAVKSGIYTAMSILNKRRGQ